MTCMLTFCCSSACIGMLGPTATCCTFMVCCMRVASVFVACCCLLLQHLLLAKHSDNTLTSVVPVVGDRKRVLEQVIYFISIYWSQSFSVGPSSQGCTEGAACYAFPTSELIRLHSRSPEWQRISSAEREKLGLTFEEDGEFW